MPAEAPPRTPRRLESTRRWTAATGARRCRSTRARCPIAAACSPSISPATTRTTQRPTSCSTRPGWPSPMPVSRSTSRAAPSSWCRQRSCRSSTARCWWFAGRGRSCWWPGTPSRSPVRSTRRAPARSAPAATRPTARTGRSARPARPARMAAAAPAAAASAVAAATAARAAATPTRETAAPSSRPPRRCAAAAAAATLRAGLARRRVAGPAAARSPSARSARSSCPA